MRLIDADALKKVIHCAYSDDLEILEKIDNAPTVDITEEQAIDKLHETGWLPRHDKEMTERPQGEWIFDYINGFGNKIGHCSKCIYRCEHYNFCPNCGTDMRGKEE